MFKDNARTQTKVTCGMLPTLRVLASRGGECHGSVCLVPLLDKVDSASHLHMTLLEAYCREIGIEVLRVSADALRSMLGPEHQDLSCVLMTNDQPHFVESPE